LGRIRSGCAGVVALKQAGNESRRGLLFVQSLLLSIHASPVREWRKRRGRMLTTIWRSILSLVLSFVASARLDECLALLDSIEDHAEADRRTLADLPLEMAVQMSGTVARISGNDHLRAEERFASALQEAFRKRTPDPQMDSELAEPRYGPSLFRWRI
jgi:hypothetical protein